MSPDSKQCQIVGPIPIDFAARKGPWCVLSAKRGTWLGSDEAARRAMCAACDWGGRYATPTAEAAGTLAAAEPPPPEVIDAATASLVERCLAICRTCDALTYDAVIAADETKQHAVIRHASNLLAVMAKALGGRQARCKECACFTGFKARILQGRGCPRHKWPNDTPDEGIGDKTEGRSS